MLNQKLDLYKRMIDVVTIICEFQAVAPEDVIEILQAEASIMTGCKLTATLPDHIVGIINDNGLEGFQRNFKEDVQKTMRCYLDGYYSNFIVTRTIQEK